MVQVQGSGKYLNRNRSSVCGSGKKPMNRTEPNFTITNNIVMSIHAIATFRTLHNYLLLRVSGLMFSGSHLSGMLTALAGVTSSGLSANKPPDQPDQYFRWPVCNRQSQTQPMTLQEECRRSKRACCRSRSLPASLRSNARLPMSRQHSPLTFPAANLAYP